MPSPSACAGIVVGVAALFIGSATLAADPLDPGSVGRVDSEVAPQEAGAAPTTRETETHSPSSAQPTRDERVADAKERKRRAKERRSGANGETELAAAL